TISGAIISLPLFFFTPEPILHITCMGTVPAVLISIRSEGFSTTSTSGFIISCLFSLDGLWMSRPPFPPAFIGAELPLSPSGRLDQFLATAKTCRPAFYLFFHIQNQGGGISIQPMTFT